MWHWCLSTIPDYISCKWLSTMNSHNILWMLRVISYSGTIVAGLGDPWSVHCLNVMRSLPWHLLWFPLNDDHLFHAKLNTAYGTLGHRKSTITLAWVVKMSLICAVLFFFIQPRQISWRLEMCRVANSYLCGEFMRANTQTHHKINKDYYLISTLWPLHR